MKGGVSEILINTHYLASLVVEFLKRSEWSQWVTVVHEERLLGTGGTILKNRAFFKNEPFLVAHADNLTIFDMPAFVTHHVSRPMGAELTMMVFKTLDPQSCGIVEIDEYDVVQDFMRRCLRHWQPRKCCRIFARTIRGRYDVYHW